MAGKLPAAFKRLQQPSGLNNRQLWARSAVRRHSAFRQADRLPTPVIRLPYEQSADNVPDIETVGPDQYEHRDFGFTISAMKMGSIMGTGYIQCTRLFILDPRSGILADSHLPTSARTDLNDLGQYVSAVIGGLVALGLSLETASATMLYGVADAYQHPVLPRLYDAPGLRVEPILERLGVKLDAVIPVLDDAVEYAIDMMTGALTLHEVHEGVYADNAMSFVQQLRDAAHCLSTREAIDADDQRAVSVLEAAEEMARRVPWAQKPGLQPELFLEASPDSMAMVIRFLDLLRGMPSYFPYVVHEAEIAQWSQWLAAEPGTEQSADI